MDAGGAVLAADGQCRRLWRIAPGGVLEEVAGEAALLDPLDVVVGREASPTCSTWGTRP